LMLPVAVWLRYARAAGVLVCVSWTGHRHVAAADLPGVLQRHSRGAGG
jgi:hypothetical protein